MMMQSMCNKVICFDLDDTLYKEIDYLKSAYREIISYALTKHNYESDSYIELSLRSYEGMISTFYEGGNAFQYLNQLLNLDLPIQEYLNIYRNHKPIISLSKEVCTILESLKCKGYILGLITDGRSIQQRNKINALGLHKWFKDENIIISEEFGSEKPCLRNYKYFTDKYPEISEYIYVGDNTNKDFITPNKLGWKTICIEDNGLNIHKQVLQTNNEYNSIYKVTFSTLLSILE